MTDQFREVEAVFDGLREKFGQGKISQREFIDSLKSLRIRDEEGRFWMIGAQSGKWYYFDGTDWVQAKPPSFGDHKAVCIYCGGENDLEAETCVHCGGPKPEIGESPACPRCGAKLEGPGASCPDCEARAGAGPAATGTANASAAAVAPAPAAVPLVIKSIHPGSLFWFSGVLGLFAGIFLGLLLGVTSLFPGIVSGLPRFFADIQGNLLGGLVFSVLGGLAGFAAGGAAGYLAAIASNGILSLVGGVGVNAVRRAVRRGDDEPS